MKNSNLFIRGLLQLLLLGVFTMTFGQSTLTCTDGTVCFTDHGSVIIIGGRVPGQLQVQNGTYHTLRIRLLGSTDGPTVEVAATKTIEFTQLSEGSYEILVEIADSGVVLSSTIIQVP